MKKRKIRYTDLKLSEFQILRYENMFLLGLNMSTCHSTSTAQVDCIQSIWATHFANLGSTSGKHFSTRFGSNCYGDRLANLARLLANKHRPVSAWVGLSDWVAGLDDLFGLLGWLVGLKFFSNYCSGIPGLANYEMPNEVCEGNFWGTFFRHRDSRSARNGCHGLGLGT